MAKKSYPCSICGVQYIPQNWRSKICGAYVCHRKQRNNWRKKNAERINKEVREKYKLSSHKKNYAHKYEKTKRGFLVRKYRNMKSRTLGIQKLKSHLYKGISLLPKGDFYWWAWNSEEYKTQFKTWEDSKYNRKLCPTVNRINSSKGYQLDNMEWVTHSENSRLGALSKVRNNKNKEKI